MKSIILSFGFLSATALGAQAATFTIDFETGSTGLDILTTPLLSPLGTISATGSPVAPCFCTDMPVAQFGNVLTEQGAILLATLTWDFDVFSITFNYGGGAGNFNGIIRDVNGVSLGSFVDPNMTNATVPYAPVTLTSTVAIRSFEFFDTEGGAAVDNVILSTGMSAVPLPATAPLLLIGLGGLAAVSRSRRRNGSARSGRA